MWYNFWRFITSSTNKYLSKADWKLFKVHFLGNYLFFSIMNWWGASRFLDWFQNIFFNGDNDFLVFDGLFMNSTIFDENPNTLGIKWFWNGLFCINESKNLGCIKYCNYRKCSWCGDVLIYGFETGKWTKIKKWWFYFFNWIRMTILLWNSISSRRIFTELMRTLFLDINF